MNSMITTLYMYADARTYHFICFHCLTFTYTDYIKLFYMFSCTALHKNVLAIAHMYIETYRFMHMNRCTDVQMYIYIHTQFVHLQNKLLTCRLFLFWLPNFIASCGIKFDTMSLYSLAAILFAYVDRKFVAVNKNGPFTSLSHTKQPQSYHFLHTNFVYCSAALNQY